MKRIRKRKLKRLKVRYDESKMSNFMIIIKRINITSRKEKRCLSV